MGHVREVFPRVRDLCAGVLEGELSLEGLQTALPEDFCTDPFLGVVREDLERGISEIPRSRFLGRVNRRAWYHSDAYGRIWFDRLLLDGRWRYLGTDDLLGYREMRNLLVGIKASEEIVGAQLDLLEPATNDPQLLSNAAYVACRDFLVKHLREASLAQGTIASWTSEMGTRSWMEACPGTGNRGSASSWRDCISGIVGQTPRSKTGTTTLHPPTNGRRWREILRIVWRRTKSCPNTSFRLSDPWRFGALRDHRA